MMIIVLGVVLLIVGFVGGNILTGLLVGKQPTKQRRIKSVTPILTVSDKVFMRAGYASYTSVTYHLSDGDHHYLVTEKNGAIVPVFEVILEGEAFDLIRINQEEYVSQ